MPLPFLPNLTTYFVHSRKLKRLFTTLARIQIKGLRWEKRFKYQLRLFGKRSQVLITFISDQNFFNFIKGVINSIHRNMASAIFLYM